MAPLFISALLLAPAIGLTVKAVQHGRRDGPKAATRLLMLGGLALFLAGAVGGVIVTPLMLIAAAAAGGREALATMMMVPLLFIGWAAIGLISIFSGAVIKYAES